MANKGAFWGIVALAAGGAALLLLSKKSEAAPTYLGEEAYPMATTALKQSAAQAAGNYADPAAEAYAAAVNSFSKAQINTPASIKAGVDVINTAAAAGVQLPRLSQTIAKVGYNSNIARLADGSIAKVSVQKPTDGGILARIAASGTKLRGGRPAVAGA